MLRDSVLEFNIQTITVNNMQRQGQIGIWNVDIGHDAKGGEERQHRGSKATKHYMRCYKPHPHLVIYEHISLQLPEHSPPPSSEVDQRATSKNPMHMVMTATNS